MNRTVWAEQINELRPTPFNRAENVLPYLDNLFGKWYEEASASIEWMNYDVYQPWSCWILPVTETPSVKEFVDPTEFLLSPEPCFYRSSARVYLRNLDTQVVTASVTSDTIAVALDPSTITAIYDSDYPIYASSDSFASWVPLLPSRTNTVICPILGTVQFRYVDSAASVTMVAGSSATLEFYPFFNALDDWGEQVMLPRLDRESNVDYAVRLKSMLAVPYDPNTKTVALDTARRIGTMEVVNWAYSHPQRTYLLNLQDLGSGFDNQATYCSYATPTTVAQDDGLRRQCYLFDGTNYAAWSPLTGFVDPGAGLGISLWAFPTMSTVGVQNLIQQGTGLSLYIADNYLCATVATLGIANIAPITTEKWQCITFEASGSNVRVAVDGKTYCIAEAAGWSFSFNEDAWVLGDGLSGKLDEVQVSNLAFDSPLAVAQQVIPTDGYPAFVISATGDVPNETYIETKLTWDGTQWLSPYRIDEPVSINEGDFYYSNYTLDGNRVSLTVSTGDHELTIRHKIVWWGGNLGIVPDQLPSGPYRVYIAKGVNAYTLNDYKDDPDNLMVDGRGILIEKGINLLKQLGDPLLWSTRTWGESLYFYNEEPPMAPTQQAWDQDLVYDV